MYGSLIRFRPLPGQEETVIAGTQRWLRERGVTTGFVGEYLLKPDDGSGEWAGIVVFDSEASYRRNAADPEQDQWYREFRATLAADPEWSDGEIIALEPASVPL